VNVYAVELVSPVTATCTYVLPSLPSMLPALPTLTVVADWGLAPMYGVTTHWVTAPPPTSVGARNETVAAASAVIDVTAVGG
jgi:hypothetical protein